MKYIHFFSFLLTILFLVSCIDNTSGNKKAKKIVEQEFSYIEEFLSPERVYNSRYRGSVEYLEALTGIESESPANFSGKYRPTKTDLEKWRKWYENNKKHLFFNPQTGNIGVDRNINGERIVEEITFRPWEDN